MQTQTQTLSTGVAEAVLEAFERDPKPNYTWYMLRLLSLTATGNTRYVCWKMANHMAEAYKLKVPFLHYHETRWCMCDDPAFNASTSTPSAADTPQ